MEKNIWLKSYPEFVPHNIDESKITNLAHLMEESYKKFPQHNAYQCMGKNLTYEKTQELANNLGSFFCNNLKLSPGEKVALMMPNILQYPIALHAAIRSSLTIVNVNPLYTERELEHQLKDSEATTIIILENFAHTLEKVIAKTPIKNIIITSLGEMLGFPKKQIVNFVIHTVKKLVPNYSLEKYNPLSFSEALEQGKENKFTLRKVGSNDIAFLQYTGGTTGVSKGAVLTHKNVCANIIQAMTWINRNFEPGKEVVITALPLYHIFSLTANCLVFMTLGAVNVLIPNPRDMSGFVKTLRKTPFTVITGVNTLFNGLLNNPEFSKINFSKLKLTLGGGMAVQEAVASKWKKTTGIPLLEAYGLTETSPAVCVNPLNLEEFNGTIGLPISSTQVSLRDDKNQEVPLGEAGELCIKGPQVMQGYWKRPEETKKVFTEDGWLKTGDIATFDKNGFIKIVDRKKDMIIVSGFNVYPNEIENVLADLPGILESAAIGVPSKKTGETVKVFIVKKEESLKEGEIIDHCRKNLTAYKIPRLIEFRKELPKTNVGKILRRALRDS
jgi:long-chain acyl-CoA synthetase